MIGGVALKETCEANGRVKRNGGIGDMEKVVVVQGGAVVGWYVSDGSMGLNRNVQGSVLEIDGVERINPRVH